MAFALPLPTPRPPAFLINDPERAQRMGACGRRAVEERYNWAIEKEQLFSLYKELINSGS